LNLLEFLEPSRIFWNLQESSGTFENLLEPSRIFWNLQEYSGTFKKLRESLGTF
jgi:hypothetical protein